jgi:hypothetical protein
VRRQARVETLFDCSRTRGVSCGHDTGSGPTAHLGDRMSSTGAARLCPRGERIG